MPELAATPTTHAPGAARPDPRLGVFETLLVLDGRPVELDAHLARLHASLTELYPDREPPPLDVPVLSGPYGHLSTGTSATGRGAMRMTVAPGAGDRLEARGSAWALEPELVGDPPPVGLRGVTLPGGLGVHKWADRSLLDAAQAQLAEDELPLLVDEDGAVLEASRANVFAVRDGALATPPLDGRILPGITRARALEIAAEAGIEARQVALSRDDLLGSDEVFLTGSVRGIERVRALDGAELSAQGEIGSGLGAALRRAWRRQGDLE